MTNPTERPEERVCRREGFLCTFGLHFGHRCIIEKKHSMPYPTLDRERDA